MFIVEFFKDQLATAMPYADFLFGNESEAAAYAQHNGMADKVDDIAAIALAVAALPKKNASRPRTVVFTQGRASSRRAVKARWWPATAKSRSIPWSCCRRIS